MANDVNSMGDEMTKGSPGMIIMQLLRALGNKMPGQLDQVMQQLGGRQPQGMPQGGPQYRVDQKLPQSPGVDANGQPIIIPPGQGGY